MSTRSRLRSAAIIATHLALHPADLADVPGWIRNRRLSTMELKCPWWPKRATEFMSAQLAAGDRVFEYGGGGSTVWLADHGIAVTAVEHNRDWYSELVAAAPNARVMLRPAAEAGVIRSDSTSGFFDDYVHSISECTEQNFDLVIVDGRARVECARAARHFVRPGGMLLLDDSDRGKYRPVRDLLADWPSKSFRGLKPGFLVPATTTVWRRPVEAGSPVRG